MDYTEASKILNHHIFEDDRRSLLANIAEYPERFIGLFRPTKPKAKIIQNLLQSHEIRFGDAIEELIRTILGDLGYTNLPTNLKSTEGDNLSIDQYFTDGVNYYFVEQKIRDDHDSTKKRGQVRNFEAKLELLNNLNPGKVVGMMYFIDPKLTKNRNYYISELQSLSEFYKVSLFLFYGAEFFTHLGYPYIWDNIISWLIRWKVELPDLPEVNFDLEPAKSFTEIRTLPVRVWRRLILEDRLWDEGIMQVLFKDGTTLELILAYFKKQNVIPYHLLSEKLQTKLLNYYNKTASEYQTALF